VKSGELLVIPISTGKNLHQEENPVRYRGLAYALQVSFLQHLPVAKHFMFISNLLFM